jgi:hypothetical protein
MTWEQAGKIAVVVVPAATFIAWLGRVIMKIVAKKMNIWIKELLFPICHKQDKMYDEMQEMKETLALTFEGVLKNIDATITGKRNGELTKVQAKMQKHLLEKINPERKEENNG